MPLIDWIWGTPEARLAKEQELALDEFKTCFNDYSEMKEQVAEKERILAQKQKFAKEAEEFMQRSCKLYENAIETMPTISDERLSLRISFEKRESQYKSALYQVRQANKDLQNAVSEMIEKDKKQKTAQAKYDTLMGRTPVINNTPNPPSVAKLPGKIQIPAAIEEHFKGKNREHVSTAQTEAVRQEVKQTRPGIDVLGFKRKLEQTLSFRMGTPNNTPNHSTHGKINSTFAFELEKKLMFEQDPEMGTIVQRPVCITFQNLFEQSRPKLPEGISEAIKARREKLGY